MYEFFLGFSTFWFAVGFLLHVVILFRNNRLIGNAWEDRVDELGWPAATVIFALTIILSICIWPHVFFGGARK